MRNAAILFALLVFGTGLFFLTRSPAQGPSPRATVDLARARLVFAEGDVEESRLWVRKVAELEVPPIAWLLAGLEDEDRNIREWSAVALGDIAPADEAVVVALMRSFEDEDDWVRWKAARALGNIGPAARSALPLLERAAADVREEVVHAAALKAVGQIRAQD